MKNRTLLNAILICSFLVFISACPYDNTQPFPTYITDLHFMGRWVDNDVYGNYTSFYDHDFYIHVTIHHNIFDYDPRFPEEIERAAAKWNDLSWMGVFFHITIDKIGPLYDYFYSSSTIDDNHDQKNLVGF